MFPFRLTNRPCLMFCFFLATCFMFFLLLLLTSILSVQSLATPCPHTWTMFVSFSTQDSKRSPRVTYCGTRLFMINSSSKIEYSVCTIISSAFNNLLSTFTFTKEYIYKTSERHVHNGDIAPPLYTEHYRYYVNDYSTKIIQSSKPSS